MFHSIKVLTKSSIVSFAKSLKSNKIGRYFLEQVLNTAMNQFAQVDHKGFSLKITIPNGLNQYRIDTFSTKEPETLNWIDQLPLGAVFWDIGANVGLYSCYAAKVRQCKVFAFEPSIFNLELLTRNLYLNNVTEQVTIVPLALNDETKTAKFIMSTTEWGGAVSTFGQSYTQDGSELAKVFEFKTVGMSMDEVVTKLNIPQPDYIKMDVDGIEHLILKGGRQVLKDVKGILVEINDNFEKQKNDATIFLHEAGLKLIDKQHVETFNESVCYNQIWGR